MLQYDIRYASRTLRRAPGFTAAAALSLALGIGANTTVFSLIDTILLRALPVREPAQLYFLANVSAAGEANGAPPYPCFEQFRDRSRSFAGMAAFTGDVPSLVVDGRAEQVHLALTSDNYFSVLGVPAILGRTLGPGDDRLDPPVAVISYRYWQSRFSGTRDALGKTVRYRGRSFTIVGVTPGTFFGLQVGHPADITIPITASDPEMLRSSGSWWFDIVGRLAPGISSARARAEIDPIFQRFMSDRGHPRELRQTFDHMELISALKGLDELRRRFSKPLALLMTIVGLVLLIACANVGNLLLARAAARRHELALRVAIGASTARLIRQLLTESLLLFALGAAVALPLAELGRRTLVGFFATGRNPILLGTGLDVRVLAFTVALSMFTGILFGLLPAVRATRLDPVHDIRGGSGVLGTGPSSRLTPSGALVALQVAMSLALVVGATLFGRTLSNLEAVDPGFRAAGVLTFSIEPIEAAFPTSRLTAMWPNLLDRVNGLPTVRSASLSVLTPLSGRDRGVGITVEGFEPRSEHDKNVHLNYVSRGYFETMGIPLLLGRSFTRDDDASATVAIVNEAAARFYFGDRNPLGATISLGASSTSDGKYQIVGVAANTKHGSLRSDVPRFLYLPMRRARERLGRLTLSVRTDGDPGTLSNAVRDQTRAISPDIVVANVTTMQGEIDRSLLQERLLSSLLGVFSVVGMLLAAIGIYGTVSYGVVRRTREIGVRMALGAPAHAVVRLAVRDIVRMVGVGIGVGLPVCLISARAIASLLYGVRPSDPLTITMSLVILFVVAGVAGYVPARRAATVDPMLALRNV